MPNKNTLFIGKVVHDFQALSSTNSYAQNLLAKSKPIEGTVISAATQTEGRGQIGSKWESPGGQSLSLSVILYPGFLVARKQFELNMVTALALRDTLSVYARSTVWVKWPNDIYLGHRKVAGILIQNQLSGQQVQHSIIGTGVNINQPSFPPELPGATSLYLDTGNRHDLPAVASAYLHTLEQRYLQLRGGQHVRLKRDYYQHLLGYQEQRTYRLPNGEEFVAEAAGVDETGRLLLRMGGQLKAFGLKEISLVPDYS
ncbi:MAG: biotin--[acetyl-CoA-carboxylase] ligase [Phaeodactylibacter sp.]|uniref:biotin--[acetyl-CoA-carboxylase] ligase n=1 Tax=Phaeodactylibacter sp. TaxID=1940289 RepID=UPI0032EAEB99